MSERYSAPEIIALKRDHHVLNDDQIDWVVDAYTRGVVADEQMSALAMAILLNGMERHEISRWTDAMIRSGERMNWSMLSQPTVDKHSTGGVGDKITLPLVPLVASCGASVPQLSGRGLGHTGGTLDKLESIPGWKAALSNEEMLHVIQETGGVICAAGSGLAPADKKLYALRDVTATVEAIPLIASSIMSKKIAEGTGSLVLDVKTGSGAFMSDPTKARELATVMVEIGKSAGVNIRALITAMDVPLGLTAGNALEVRESVEVLAGGGFGNANRFFIVRNLVARRGSQARGITGSKYGDYGNFELYEKTGSGDGYPGVGPLQFNRSQPGKCGVWLTNVYVDTTAGTPIFYFPNGGIQTRGAQFYRNIVTSYLQSAETDG